MKVLEQTSERLVFRTGVPLINASRCEFDRSSGRARLKRTTVILPRKQMEWPLSDIVDVQSLSVYTAMEGSNYETKIPQIVLASGQCIKLSVGSMDTTTAPKVIGLVKEFLTL